MSILSYSSLSRASLPSVSAVALLALRAADLLTSPPSSPVVCQVSEQASGGLAAVWKDSLARCEARLEEAAFCKVEDERKEKSGGEQLDLPVWSVLEPLVLEKVGRACWACCRRCCRGHEEGREVPTHFRKARIASAPPQRAHMLGGGVLE